MLEYFEQSCGSATCHGSSHLNTAENAVDLETPPVFQRLSTQNASSPACADVAIIDEADWQNSYLIRALRGQQGFCGERMPYDETLSETSIQCIGAWIRAGRDE